MTPQPPRMLSLTVRTVESPAQPGACIEGLARRECPLMLDSSARHERWGRRSVLACCPVETMEIREGRLLDAAGRVLADTPDAIWRTLAEAMRFDVRGPVPAGLPLPGWYGYFGYEVGRIIERLPARALRDTALPDMRLGLYDAVLSHDAISGLWTLTQATFEAPPPRAGRGAAELLKIIDQAPAGAAPAASPVEASCAAPRPLPAATSNFTPDAYRAAVARAVEYIAAGDIFQVNLSQRLEVQAAAPAVELYRALRARNPAWYAAFMTFPSAGQPCAILSASPELFLDVHGGGVLTRPIKGTRPRCGQADHDALMQRQLLASEKDNAELAMIIDLLRNDLGRVCQYGSVRVAEPRRLETHPTVFHLVGTVAGQLRPEASLCDLLRATLPGGSITGAPKIRAMEIIDELEGLARGVYTGVIGYADVRGDGAWNIAIRTIVRSGRRTFVQVGGGIVADSNPQAEYEETLAKARGLLEAIALAETTNC